MFMKYFFPIRQLFILSCLIIIYTQAKAQTDSLRQLLLDHSIENGKYSNDSNTVAICNELAYLYRNTNIDSALFFANNAWDISLATDNTEGQILSLIRKSALLHRQNKFDQALSLLFKAIKLLDQHPHTKHRATAYNTVGIIYKKQGFFKEAIKYYIKSLNITQDKKTKASVLNNIAIVHGKLHDYNKALNYFMQSLEIEKNLHNDERISRIYQNIALTHYSKGEMEHVKSWLQKSLDLEEKMSNPIGMAQIYSLQADLEEENNDHTSALQKRFKALEIYKQQKHLTFERDELVNIGINYLRQEKYQKSISELKAALKMVEKSGEKQLKRACYYNLSSAYKHIKNYKESLYYLQEYNAIKDSIFNEIKSKQIAELEEKYESERKEKEILQLQTENEKQQNDLAQKESFVKIVLIVSTLLVLIIILLFMTYREKMRSNLIESKHQRTLEQQKTLELLKNQEIEMINALMEVQEKERSRIAEEIHDHLGNNLATIKLFFDTLHPQMDVLEAPYQKQYSKAVKLLEKTCADVRKIATDIASNILTKFGLVAAVKEMANLIADAGNMNVQVMSYGLQRRLDSTIEIALFRVIQELMTNALKHSNATEASIQITKHEHSLNIIVEDNGKGFHPKKVEAGMGLKNINSRLEKIKGDIVIDSGKGAGTTITIDLVI